jgi:prepilin-type N-terminal cleavage/methylation domain-containing protein
MRPAAPIARSAGFSLVEFLLAVAILSVFLGSRGGGGAGQQ